MKRWEKVIWTKSGNYVPSHVNLEKKFVEFLSRYDKRSNFRKIAVYEYQFTEKMI